MYYVYILQSSKSGILYYGYTKDLKRRVQAHNSGKTQSTKGHMPWEIVWYSVFRDKERAKDFELYIKSGSGKALAYKRLVRNALAKDRTYIK